MQLSNAGTTAERVEEGVNDERPPKSSQIDQVSGIGRSRQQGPAKASSQEKPNQLVFVSFSLRRGSHYVPKRTRSTVSVRADDTDTWGNEEVDHKEEFMLMLNDPTHRDSLLERLNTFRRNRELCDVVLFVREKEILAHKRYVLDNSPPPPTAALSKSSCSSKSSIPNATLASPSQQALAYYEFGQADYDCFTALVNFAYTSQLEVSSRKIGELYKTAFSLQMSPVVRACALFLAQNLSVANCIGCSVAKLMDLGVRKQANFSNDEQLVNKVDTFIADNFPQIVDQCVEFTQLTCIKVRIIVNLDDAKQTRCGMNLAERALQYFQSLPTNSDRADVIIEQLADKTHLLYVEEDQTLQDCAEMDDRSSVGSCDIIQDYKRTGGHQPRSASTGTASVGTLPVQHHVTGATAVHLNASRVTNSKFSSNESLNSIATTSSDPDEEILSKLIAVHQTSGERSNGNVDLKSVECYDPKTGKWTTVKPLERGRSHNGMFHESKNVFFSACASLDGFVYCIGGSSEQVVLKECERYDPEKEEWEQIPSMQTARFQTGCTAWRGMVVACGGCDRWNCLDSVEAYDPKTETWKFLPKLKTPRRGCAVAVVRDSLYVIGGHDGTQSLSSVEILDHPNGQWRVGPSLNTPRANTHAAVTAGNVIYVLGGFDGGQFLSSIELLDNESLGWRGWCQRKKSVSMSDTAITEEEEFEDAENETSLASDDHEAPFQSDVQLSKQTVKAV
ncbi:unnamed protein product [Toxocara canis]|uniref:BTB domain-containing protein n=1 Tax=Toxocara canis TaxID=6265 RepID=A0A183UMN1_TOXCA|nr:unnamed protein product [Toxocara canis]